MRWKEIDAVVIAFFVGGSWGWEGVGVADQERKGERGRGER